MRLGNGRFESTQFNSRLQPTQIALGTSAFNTSLLKLNYDYGTTDNNGNVKQQTITVPNMANPLIQTYAYDSLNRLQSATETSNSIQTWKQTFIYDRYGNRRFDMSQTTMPDPQSNQAITNPQIDQANNRFLQSQGYFYDAAGNLTQDASGKRFFYDAENKQTKFYQSGNQNDNNPDAIYSYDGGGQRVKKKVGNETTVFVYDAMGKMVAEYTINAPTNTNPQISYLTTDTLGSPRINTNASGQVSARHDYLPFGEEINAGVSGRTTIQGYPQPLSEMADGVRNKFTGQIRDEESSLDFFNARYYSPTNGRFTSTDPLMASGRVEIPQSWNRYVYVLNNPLALFDPSGMIDDDPQKEKQNQQPQSQQLQPPPSVIELLRAKPFLDPQTMPPRNVPTTPIIDPVTNKPVPFRPPTLAPAPASSVFARVLLGFARAAGPIAIILLSPISTGGPPPERRDPSGVAFVHYFAPGVVGPVGHYSITVYTNDEISADRGLGFTTELTGFPDTTVATTFPINPTSSHSIPLPNAIAAKAFQQTSLGPAGPYNFQTNSCVTHVGSVLRAGGVQNVGVTGTQVMNYFRSVGIPTKWRPTTPRRRG
jgi:RHS repeat-associated protein